MLRLFLDYTDKTNLRKQSKTNSAIPAKQPSARSRRFQVVGAFLDPATPLRSVQNDTSFDQKSPAYKIVVAKVLFFGIING